MVDFKLYNYLEKAINFLRTNLKECIQENKEQQSFLYKILQDSVIFQKLDTYQQAKSIFLAEEGSPIFIKLDFIFNLEKSTGTTLYINMPSESNSEQTLSTSEFVNETQESYYIRRFLSNYDICIYSENSNIVLILYTVLKRSLISLMPSMSVFGFQNIKLNGADLQMYNQISINYFMRIIKISFEYEERVFAIENFSKLLVENPKTFLSPEKI